MHRHKLEQMVVVSTWKECTAVLLAHAGAPCRTRSRAKVECESEKVDNRAERGCVTKKRSGNSLSCQWLQRADLTHGK